MPETTRGYYYPTISEPPAGPFALEQLAEGVDADVQGIDTRLTVREPFALVSGGLESITTNAEGYATLIFDPPFPGGLTGAVVNDATPTAGAITIKYISGNETSVNFRCFASTGQPIVGTPLQVTYVATGY